MARRLGTSDVRNMLPPVVDNGRLNPDNQIMSRNHRISRREFLRSTRTTAVGLGAGLVLPNLFLNRTKAATGDNPSEFIRVGFIGTGGQGQSNMRAILKNAVAVCDADKSHAAKAREAVEKANPGRACAVFSDYRRLLEDKSIDAVLIATPDHWHALPAIEACMAGKDVYCEKPLTLTIHEGQALVKAARQYKRVFQTGSQQRSDPKFLKACEYVRSGRLGQVKTVEVGLPGVNWTKEPPVLDSEPPAELDYERWLGPAPYRPYNKHRVHYYFRFFWDYSGGQMTNLGQHSLDLVHWMTGAKAPKSVYSTGGRFFIKDDGEVPDTQDAIFEYPGFTTVCQYRECTAGRSGQGMGGLLLHGTFGTMAVSRSGFEVWADPKVSPNNVVARVLPTGHPVGGPQPEPEPEPRQFWTAAVKDDTGEAMEDYGRHARNFLDCIKSRQAPATDLESGHRVATSCHLANLSMKIGRKIVWDAEKEEIVGDPEASRLLVRPYRKPWDAELRSLGVA